MTTPGPATTLPIATPARTRAAVAALLRTRWPLLALTGAVLVLATLAVLAIPLLLGAIIDVATGARPGELDVLALGVLAAAVASAVFRALGSALLARLGEGLLAQLRERVLERALRAPQAVVERAGSGDLVSRVGGDVAVAAEGIRSALPALVTAVLEVGLTLGGLGVLDPRLALAGLAPLPVWVLATRWYVRTSGPRYAAARAAAGDRTQALLDGVDGAATVRALRLQESTLRRIAKASRATVDADLRAYGALGPFGASINAAELLGTATMLATGFLLVRADAVTVGAATAAALYVLRLFNPIGLALFLFDQAQSTGTALARLVGVTDLPAAPHRHARGSLRTGSVRLRGIRQSYDGGREVLHGIDLDVAERERVAVVGTSGAGKTTLAAVLAGLAQPLAGTAEIGGVAPADLDEPSRHIALVTQEVHVFAGTVADNLRLARATATDAELRAALERVGAPLALDDVVGDGGTELDATTAQQVALARLLLADPAVAVLDEATAEAGSLGARQLERAADAALTGRTAVVVAHRLTQARTADRIVVLDAGRIIENGTHAELVARGGHYAALWAAWSRDGATR